MGKYRKINEFHHVLTREMNLLLISAHAGGADFTHLTKQKILLDAGMLLKSGPVDWDKVHRLADRWDIVRPDILFSIRSVFFPKGVLPEESIVSEQQKCLREIFEMRHVVFKYSHYENHLAKVEPHNVQWFLRQLKYYTPSRICLKYHIPPHHPVKMIRYGIQDFFEKIFFFLKHSKSQNPELQEYYGKIADFERMRRSPR